MQNRFLSLAAVAALALLGACQADLVAPVSPITPSTQPGYLLAPGEGLRTIVDSVDAGGNRIMVVEYAAGTSFPNGEVTDGSSVGSVTIRSFFPNASTSSSGGACITSTIDHIDTTPGWTASVKKPGGCDKAIEVAFENKQAGLKTLFSFLMIPGKTRIDFGAVR